MKKLFISILLLFPLFCSAQILDPSKWKVSLSRQEVKVNGTVDIVFSVTIDDQWYFYTVGENPPQASFEFEENDSYKLVGKIKEGAGVKEKLDSNLEIHVRYFEKAAEFRQTIKVLKENPVIKIEVEGQVCSYTTGQCVRLAKKFTVDKIKVIASLENNNSTAATDKNAPPKLSEIKPDTSAKLDENTTSSSGNVDKLESEKAKLVKKDENGKDEATEYLKNFVNKYGEKK